MKLVACSRFSGLPAAAWCAGAVLALASACSGAAGRSDARVPGDGDGGVGGAAAAAPDGSGLDARPSGIDAAPDGAADVAIDRSVDASVPDLPVDASVPDLPVDASVPDLPPAADGSGEDWPLSVDAAGPAADAAADVPADLGAGGAGGNGETGGGGTGGVYLLVVNPPSIDFGIVAPGSTSAVHSLTIVNAGTAPTSALATVVTDVTHFPVSSDGCAGTVLGPGDSCVIALVFAPTAAGTVRAEGSVAAAAGTGTPAQFSLGGAGSGGAPSLSLSAATFGIVDVGQTVSQTMTLTNSGDSGAGTVTIQVTGSPAFSVTGDACSGVALGRLSQCTFTLRFSPTTFGAATAAVSAQSSSGLSTSASAAGTGRDHVLLTIQLAGSGGGAVNGVTPACASPGPCSIDVVRTAATVPGFDLAAQPDSLSVFGGWSGACTGTGACAVTMDQARSVTATFDPRMVPISLTVLGFSDYTGTVASADGAIECSGNCPDLSHAATTRLTLEARPADRFVAWSDGPCRGANPRCTLSLTQAVSVTATFGPQAYMFVTSTTVVPGLLGGVEAADKRCQELAAAAGLPGTYRAWLPTTGIEARQRVGEGGWVRTDGRPFALSLKTLADATTSGYPTVYYPPRLDEEGNDLGNVGTPVATGGGTDGTPVVEQCGGYTSTTGDLYVGDASSGSHAWSYSHVVAGGCARPHRLYCFRTQAAGKIQPPVQKGRRVFVSPRPFVVGSTDPTEFCAREAAEAGLADPGNFVAFLATGGSPALKLIGSTGPWKRLDEVIVAGQASDFANGRLLAPINLGPDGFTYLPNRVWTGATYSSAEGSATCGDWTGISASALVGDSRTTAAPAWFSLGEAGSVPCKDENTHLMCIEP